MRDSNEENPSLTDAKTDSRSPSCRIACGSQSRPQAKPQSRRSQDRRRTDCVKTQTTHSIRHRRPPPPVSDGVRRPSHALRVLLHTEMHRRPPRASTHDALRVLLHTEMHRRAQAHSVCFDKPRPQRHHATNVQNGYIRLKQYVTLTLPLVPKTRRSRTGPTRVSRSRADPSLPCPFGTGPPARAVPLPTVPRAGPIGPMGPVWVQTASATPQPPPRLNHGFIPTIS